MFTLKSEYRDSYLLYINDDSFLIKNVSIKSLICYANNLVETWSLTIKQNTGKFLSAGIKRFLFYEDGKTTIYNIENGDFLYCENRFYFVYSASHKVFLDTSNVDAIGIEDNNTMSLIYLPYDNSSILSNDTHLFCFNQNSLSVHSLSTGQALWQANISKLGEYKNIDDNPEPGTVDEVFVLDGCVVAKVIALSLVGYDIATGVQKWKHRFTSGFMFEVALHEGLLHVFADDYYLIDGNSGAIIIQKPYREMFTQANLKPYWYTGLAVNDKYIAVSSHYDASIVLINRETFTIAQIIKLEGCKNGIPRNNTPRLYGNRLFQLDGDGTLHLFEEE